jgi:[acyl-carrier-protein] S-malonyltransferase
VLVLLAPGQGAQSAGMLLPWLDLAGAREDVAAWSAATDLDLLRMGTEGTAEQVRDTAVAQPLLTVAALLSSRAVLGERYADVVVGHSVGELAALALAGVLDDATAVGLAAERGAAMARASTLRPTGMAAVLGGDADDVRGAADRCGLTVATVNGVGQLVLGGPVEGLDALPDSMPPGVRVRRLDVAGAFHTAAMLPALDRFQAVVRELRPAAPRVPVVANADGAVVADGRALLDRLVGQLTAPVRFDLCLNRLRSLGASAVVELAPGGTLAGVVRRALPDVPVVALRGPDDLSAARAVVAQAAAA